MKLVGYNDRWSVQPGESVRFYVSAEVSRYHADLVRLIHGDENSTGPGFKEELLSHGIAGEYSGSVQAIHPGSYAVVDPFPALSAFTVQAWVWPTRPEAGVQGILSRWSADTESGFGLFIGADGTIELWLGSPGQFTERVSSGRVLRPREWTFIAASYDPEMPRSSKTFSATTRNSLRKRVANVVCPSLISQARKRLFSSARDG